jgi:hypothetical protein
VGPGGHPSPQDAPEPAAHRIGSHPASTSAGRPWLRAPAPRSPLGPRVRAAPPFKARRRVRCTGFPKP